MTDHSDIQLDHGKRHYAAGEYNDALPYLEAAAETQPYAHHLIGVMSQLGLGGLDIDMNKAARHYILGAQSGIADAALNLAILYHAGLVEGGQLTDALTWYAEADHLGHPKAADKLEEVERLIDPDRTHRLQAETYHAKRRSLWDRLIGRR